MRIIRSPEIFQRLMETERLAGRRIGFVPTMGALHDGHLSLVRAAIRENDVVAVSIFVNPVQFGPREDFKKYPRPFGRDRQLLEAAKIDYLFCPAASAMYGAPFQTWVEVGEGSGMESLAKTLCGKSRPGHFRGVATVVTKLFHLAKPHRVYFGTKDFQQVRIVETLIGDLNFDIRVRRMPIVRDDDGLAMSSRNRYLSPQERRRARELPAVLLRLKAKIRAGRRDLPELRREALRELRRSVDRIDYLEIVDPCRLNSLRQIQPVMLAAAACFIGKTRLIDNVIITLPQPEKKVHDATPTIKRKNSSSHGDRCPHRL